MSRPQPFEDRVRDVRPQVALLVAALHAGDVDQVARHLRPGGIVVPGLGGDIGLLQELLGFSDLAEIRQEQSVQLQQIGQERRVPGRLDVALETARPVEGGLRITDVALGAQVVQLLSEPVDPAAGAFVARKGNLRAQTLDVATDGRRRQVARGGDRLPGRPGVGLHERVRQRADPVQVVGETAHPKIEDRLGLVSAHARCLARLLVHRPPLRDVLVQRRGHLLPDDGRLASTAGEQRAVKRAAP